MWLHEFLTQSWLRGRTIRVSCSCTYRLVTFGLWRGLWELNMSLKFPKGTHLESLRTSHHELVHVSLPSHIAPKMRNICSLSPIFWSIKWYYNEFFNILFVPALIEILRFQQSNNFLFILWSNGKKIWGLHLEVPLGNLLSPTQNPCLHIHTYISPLAFLALWKYWLNSELFF